MDEQEAGGSLPLDSEGVREQEARLKGCAKFTAWLPSIAPAIRIHGESGLRIQLDIADSDIAEALKLVLWRKCVFEVTVRPVLK